MENENMEMVNVDTTAEVENESSTGKNIAIIGLGAALLGAPHMARTSLVLLSRTRFRTLVG